jgi:hypothetical protein
MPDDDYAAKLAEFNAEADRREEEERMLVAQANKEDAFSRELVRRYDIALENRDQVGIDAYMVEVRALNERQIAIKAALNKVRAEYDVLARQRPRPPRRTWRRLFGG